MTIRGTKTSFFDSTVFDRYDAAGTGATCPPTCSRRRRGPIVANGRPGRAAAPISSSRRTQSREEIPSASTVPTPVGEPTRRRTTPSPPSPSAPVGSPRLVRATARSPRGTLARAWWSAPGPADGAKPSRCVYFLFIFVWAIPLMTCFFCQLQVAGAIGTHNWHYNPTVGLTALGFTAGSASGLGGDGGNRSGDLAVGGTRGGGVAAWDVKTGACVCASPGSHAGAVTIVQSATSASTSASTSSSTSQVSSSTDVGSGGELSNGSNADNNSSFGAVFGHPALALTASNAPADGEFIF